jgi:diaminopimelate decarboxylase
MYLPDSKKLLSITSEYGTPTYAYDLNKIKQQYRKLDKSITYESKQIYYAVKANWHPMILQTLKNEGCGIECVSRGEVEHAINNNFNPNEIIFTGSGQTKEDLVWIAKQGVQINLDSLHQLKVLGDLNSTLN